MRPNSSAAVARVTLSADTGFALRPGTGRMRWGRRGARLRIPGAWSRAKRARFLAGLLDVDGLHAACKAAGVTQAQAVAERMRDPAFRRDWLAADAERLDLAETHYIDQLLAALAPTGADRPAALQDKGALSVWQLLRDGRKRVSGAAVPSPAATVQEVRAEAPAASSDAAEIAALIARVEAGIAAAEAELGLSPGVVRQGS